MLYIFQIPQDSKLRDDRYFVGNLGTLYQSTITLLLVSVGHQDYSKCRCL